jgi:pimeloyl-ACP methyl ester carboxylesterase
MPRTEELRVSAGDATLVGTLTLPGGDGRHPNVLLLPSWLPRNRDGSWDLAAHPTWFAQGPPAARGLLARFADALADAGVASLRCDPRGCGASDGEWGEVSLFTRIDDARDMLAAMRSHGALDLRRTGILGYGEGALVALSVAIGDPAVGALTLIGPAARPWQDVLRRGVAARARHGTDLEHPLVASMDRWSEEMLERAVRGEVAMDLVLAGGERVRLALAGVEQAMHTPALALATMLHRSVTIAHGSQDRWAHPDESLLLVGALPDAGAEPRRVVIDGAGHDLAEASDAQIAALAADLAARLQPRDLPPVLLAIEEMG